jgi:hypothetical protein
MDELSSEAIRSILTSLFPSQMIEDLATGLYAETFECEPEEVAVLESRLANSRFEYLNLISHPLVDRSCW